MVSQEAEKVREMIWTRATPGIKYMTPATGASSVIGSFTAMLSCAQAGNTLALSIKAF